jgi:hypothetical protein
MRGFFAPLLIYWSTFHINANVARIIPFVLLGLILWNVAFVVWEGFIRIKNLHQKGKPSRVFKGILGSFLAAFLARVLTLFAPLVLSKVLSSPIRAFFIGAADCMMLFFVQLY